MSTPKKLELNQPYSQEFDKDFMNNYFAEIETKTYETLEEEKQELEEKLAELEIKIDKDFKAAIQSFIYLEDSQLSFGLGDWILIRTIRDKKIGETLSFPEYHNLTEFLKKARVISPDSIDVCLELLDMTFSVNIEIGTRQWKIQQLANLIIKKINEKEQGLEHDPKDHENNMKLIK